MTKVNGTLNRSEEGVNKVIKEGRRLMDVNANMTGDMVGPMITVFYVISGFFAVGAGVWIANHIYMCRKHTVKKEKSRRVTCTTF